MFLSPQVLMFSIKGATNDIDILAYNRLLDTPATLPPTHQVLARANYYSSLYPAPPEAYASTGEAQYPDSGFYVSINSEGFFTLKTANINLVTELLDYYYNVITPNVTDNIMMRGNVTALPITVNSVKSYNFYGNFVVPTEMAILRCDHMCMENGAQSGNYEKFTITLFNVKDHFALSNDMVREVIMGVGLVIEPTLDLTKQVIASVSSGDYIWRGSKQNEMNNLKYQSAVPSIDPLKSKTVTKGIINSGEVCKTK